MPAAAINARLATIRLDPNAELLRRADALDLFAKLFADDMTAAKLVDWAVYQELRRLVDENAMDKIEARATCGYN